MDITDPAAQAAVRKISDAIAHMLVSTALALVDLNGVIEGAPQTTTEAVNDPQPEAPVEKPAKPAKPAKAKAAEPAPAAPAASPAATTTTSDPAPGTDILTQAKDVTVMLNGAKGRATTVELLAKFDAAKASEIDGARLPDYIAAAKAVIDGASVEDAISALGDDDLAG